MFLMWVLVGCFVAKAHGSQETRYIDDTYGDSVTGALPVYHGSWLSVSYNCVNCTGGLKPDFTKLHNGTYHDNTRFSDPSIPGFNFSFTGTSFAVYCIIPNHDRFRTSMSFVVDGVHAHDFEHTPDSSNTFVYSFPVLAMKNMGNTQHIVQVTNAKEGATILFDYVEYTFDDGPVKHIESADTSRRLAIILSTVLGVLAIIVGVAVLYFRRRSQGQVPHTQIAGSPSFTTFTTTVTPYSESYDSRERGSASSSSYTSESGSMSKRV
ncbi:hypothetical protein VNI00_007875 [Paramarasmius palmivorus]|uniref:Uncharacterized protein n=1 Tax=Paramarasmius palmivorus TaxID=297713 RepID=A0AAW0CZE6_9AGAR